MLTLVRIKSSFPDGAAAVFEVSFNLSYGFGTGGNVEDLVNVNFNTGSNAVFCPFVLLAIFSHWPIRNLCPRFFLSFV